METHLNESKEVGLKIHKEKTKYMTNYKNKEIIEKVDEYNYFGQIVDPSQEMEAKINARIKTAWSSYRKNKDIFMDKELALKR